MRVEVAIRRAVHPGLELRTPSRKKPFLVHSLDSEGVVLLLGSGRWRTRIDWECLEGVVPFIQDRGGEIPIGGRHDVKGNPGTLDEWLKKCVSRTTAGWVAVVLEKAGVVEVVGRRPQRVRLTAEWAKGVGTQL
jgi:hypothetical protein